MVDREAARGTRRGLEQPRTKAAAAAAGAAVGKLSLGSLTSHKADKLVMSSHGLPPLSTRNSEPGTYTTKEHAAPSNNHVMIGFRCGTTQ